MVINHQRTVLGGADFADVVVQFGKRHILRAGDVSLTEILRRTQVDNRAVVVGQHRRTGVAHLFAGGIAPLQLKINDAADGRKEHEKEENVVEEKLTEAHLMVP